MFSFSPPFIQNLLSNSPPEPIQKLIQHLKTTTLTYTTFQTSTTVSNIIRFFSETSYTNLLTSVRTLLSKSPPEPIQKLIQHLKTTTLTYTTFKHLQLYQISSNLAAPVFCRSCGKSRRVT